MKQFNHIFRKTCLTVFVCTASIYTHAQGFSAAGTEWLKEQRLWFQSQNAAGSIFDDTQNYSNVELNYQNENGTFTRPQKGYKEQTVGVSSEGFLNLKDALVWGSFSFSQENKYDAGYNASITDPYRGMPYYIVDNGYLSDWRNQYYDLRFRVATPLYWDKLAFGLSGVYQASLAAKQRDPRVDTRFYTLELVPGLTYAINDRHHVGANFIYASIKEDSRMSTVNSYVYQTYYALYGLGVATVDIGSGRTTNYYGDKLGAALQYQYVTPRLNLLIEGTYTKKAEIAEISYTSPRKHGAVDDQVFQVGLNLQTRGGTLTHILKLDYTYRDIDGIQYINQYDNSISQTGWMELYHNIRSTYKTQQANATYSIVKPQDTEYNWRVDLSIAYESQNDEYILPNSTKDHKNLYMQLGGKKNFILKEKLTRRLLVAAHAGYNNNLSGSYVYGGQHADYITVTELETEDENYLTSDYYMLGISAAYSQQIKAESRTHMFVKAGFDYVKTSNYDFSHRSYLSVSLGCNF